MADSEPKMLLKHIGLKPGQYSPLSKLKLACTIGDVEAVNKLLASGTDPLATGAPIDWHHDTPAIHHCIIHAQPACLEALLATGNLELLEQATFTGVTPCAPRWSTGR